MMMIGEETKIKHNNAYNDAIWRPCSTVRKTKSFDEFSTELTLSTGDELQM